MLTDADANPHANLTLETNKCETVIDDAEFQSDLRTVLADLLLLITLPDN